MVKCNLYQHKRFNRREIETISQPEQIGDLSYYMERLFHASINAMETPIAHKTTLILHGHFYQPPRENPLVDIIPQQPSAKPHADWNERIYDDCYRANAFSRYLDGYGHIRAIVNNYEYISFNFGPTLLNWLEQYHKATYRKIIDADKKSLERLGHGNAIAQAYNHTILPLANRDDAETQIIWGIQDFIHRFDRSPEGIWLPETAVNKMVVDLLHDAGITFVILSPWQCAKVETENGSHIDVDGNTVPYDTPFLIEGESGNTISAFFYHPQLASSISFGHMLRDADSMYGALEHIVQNDRPRLLHTATDGEIYGHHEPFGDMALAALIRKVHEKDRFEFSNYATYLETHPATRGAILHDGEEKKGTSWSCAHGVSRWYKDCGCHTGGEDSWNQRWRTPLRDAFATLGSAVDEIFAVKIGELFDQKVDPKDLLHDYSSVLSKQEDITSFIERWEHKTDMIIADHRMLAELLEGQKYKHYTFTSCGWFFSDLSGIEPRQNIHYAVRAMELYQRFTDKNLQQEVLPLLAEAKSNKRHVGSGRSIAKSYMTGVGGEAEAGAYFLMNKNFARAEDQKTRYGKYRLTAYKAMEDGSYLFEVLDTSTLRQDTLRMEVGTEPENGYLVEMEITDDSTGDKRTHTFSSAHIPVKMLDEVYTWIDRSLSRITDDQLEHIAHDIRHYSLLIKNGRTAPSETLYIENMGTCLRALRSIFTTPDTLPWEHKRESISHLLGFIKRKGRQKEYEIVQTIFSNELVRVSTLVAEHGFTYERASYLLEVLNVAREQGIQPTVTHAQESLYPYIKGAQRLQFSTPLSGRLLDELHVALNFSAD